MGNSPYSQAKTHKNETWEHFIVKCILWKLIQEKGGNGVIECDVGSGTADVADLRKGICYEVQGQMSKTIVEQKMSQFKLAPDFKDMVVISLKKLGVDSKSLRELVDKIEGYVW